MLKLYFPSIEAESISSYLELNKEAYASNEQFYKNCLTLSSILSETLKIIVLAYKHFVSAKAIFKLLKSTMND